MERLDADEHSGGQRTVFDLAGCSIDDSAVSEEL